MTPLQVINVSQFEGMVKGKEKLNFGEKAQSMRTGFLSREFSNIKFPSG